MFFSGLDWSDPAFNASFIYFSRTPVEQNDANTRAVFGEYVLVHGTQQVMIEKATLPIDHASRVAKLSLNQAELPKVDSKFQEITEGKEADRKRKLKTKVASCSFRTLKIFSPRSIPTVGSSAAVAMRVPVVHCLRPMRPLTSALQQGHDVVGLRSH